MKKRLTLISGALAVFLTLAIIYNLRTDPESRSLQQRNILTQEVQGIRQIEYRFGIPVDSFEVVESVIGRGESFGNILQSYGVGYPVIHRIAHQFRDIFDVRHLRMGKPYALFCESTDSTRKARFMVYQPSPVDYYVFDLSDSARVYSGKKDVTTVTREVSGEINSSLYEALVEKGASPELTMKLSNIYAWSIDFFRIRKGDSFKVIFEEQYIDDTVQVGVGRILAADFNHGGRSFYSFYYENGEEYRDYFDEEGNTLRKAFLKAPLQFSRISSRYSPKRFHPVLKRYKAHLGTDYAAPHGTPIVATADGEVIAAAYTGGNGNYVKIRHNSTYTTQYLHMSKFAKGMRRGKVVKQGDLIGYVGSTGLATGPHVCYRFWKNGRQVDPYQQDLPHAEPVEDKYREDFTVKMLELKKRLDELEIKKARDTDVYIAGAPKSSSSEA